MTSGTDGGREREETGKERERENVMRSKKYFPNSPT